MRHLTTLILTVLVLTGGLQAQQRQTRQSSSSTSSRTWTRDRNTTNRSTTSVTPSVSRSPNVGVSRSVSSGGSGWIGDRGSYSPVDPYRRISSQFRGIAGYRYQLWDLYNCDLFFSRLQMEFGYARGRDAFWTFVQGWPALTPQAAELALTTSTHAADRMLGIAADLSNLLDLYETGALDQAQLENDVKLLLNQLRLQAKQVRSDFYVSYLDQRRTRKSKGFDPASSVDGLRNLISELRTRALDLKRDFDQFFSEDRTRVISVDELTKPSFKSKSKEIDKLATAIKKSVVRL